MNAITAANTIIIGARTNILMICWNTFCIIVTSVVVLTMSDEVENLSVLANEKDWILSNIARRRFFEKPIEATAAVLAPSIPQPSDRSAASTISPPRVNMSSMEPVLSSAGITERRRKSSLA